LNLHSWLLRQKYNHSQYWQQPRQHHTLLQIKPCHQSSGGAYLWHMIKNSCDIVQLILRSDDLDACFIVTWTRSGTVSQAPCTTDMWCLFAWNLLPCDQPYEKWPLQNYGSWQLPLSTPKCKCLCPYILVPHTSHLRWNILCSLESVNIIYPLTWTTRSNASI